ncbi:ATP-binding protein [Pseudovibrio sp. Alg231-02]|uniref:ATP-binding protein n=1 Tax=Pseudovibrio sp. Alg231-02 TaxID=1922223 RepID=UPI000D555958|nr:MoxR family ATPase [Pseudovibrio sp. Alg231-02]
MAINAMTVSAGRALEVLKSAWDMQLNTGKAFSWMMHGPPGVGKTQVAEALACYVGGKLYDVRLTQIDTADLRGLPYYDHQSRTTQWYRPEDLPRCETPAVLFLDEITAASPLLQPTVYGLLQERRVGVHVIPDQTLIIAAGNTVDDGAIAYEMGSAISDRLIHMIVQAEPEDWLKSFALKSGLHPAVPAFIKSRPDLLETLSASMQAEHMIAATPRSWERVSHIMTHVADRQNRMVMVAGAVGTAVASEFLRAADDIEASVTIEALVEAPRKSRAPLYPNTLHGLNALIFGLVGYLNDKNIDAVIECTLDIGELQILNPKSVELKKIPLREIATAGFEMIIETSLQKGLADHILSNPAYHDHQKKREAQGLA